MISVTKHRRETPKWIMDYLRVIGGTNVYGEPNFIVYWGESHPQPGLLTATGEYLASTPQISGVTAPIFYDFEKPCWIMAMWHNAYDPDRFFDSGPPELWDGKLFGPYPYRGAYHTVQEFRKDGPNGIEPSPAELSTRILAMVTSIVRVHRFDSYKKRMKVLEEKRERENRELENRIADRLQDAVPQFQNAVSYRGQPNCKEPLVRQKMEQIERNYVAAIQYARQHPGRLSIAG